MTVRKLPRFTRNWLAAARNSVEDPARLSISAAFNAAESLELWGNVEAITIAGASAVTSKSSLQGQYKSSWQSRPRSLSTGYSKLKNHSPSAAVGFALCAK